MQTCVLNLNGSLRLKESHLNDPEHDCIHCFYIVVAMKVQNLKFDIWNLKFFNLRNTELIEKAHISY